MLEPSRQIFHEDEMMLSSDIVIHLLLWRFRHGKRSCILFVDT
jgi:hypothetical protein